MHQVEPTDGDFSLVNFGSAYNGVNKGWFSRKCQDSQTQEWNQSQNEKHASVKALILPKRPAEMLFLEGWTYTMAAGLPRWVGSAGKSTSQPSIGGLAESWT